VKAVAIPPFSPTPRYRIHMTEKSNWDKMRDGEPYIADDPAIEAAWRRAMDLMDAYNASGASNTTGRRAILEELCAFVGEGVELRPPIYVDYGTNLTIGHRVFANFGLTALDVASITIGDDVQIGPHVQLLTPTHPTDPVERRDKWEAASPIVIGDNVWLGGGAIVLAGVTIGENSIIGAGAVVTKDIPANVVAVGNPAKVIKTLPG
jgi:maltose O-acetyltransferase